MRMRESNRATKETGANTPVPEIMMPAVVAIHAPRMKKGICFAQSRPANIAGRANALNIAAMNKFPYYCMKKHALLLIEGFQYRIFNSPLAGVLCSAIFCIKKAYTNHSVLVNP
jgi:hypothetical protein